MGGGGIRERGMVKGESTLHENYLVFTADPFLLLDIVDSYQCKHGSQQFELL